jgi:hypothetical protein
MSEQQCKHCRHVRIIWRPAGQYEIKWCELKSAAAVKTCGEYDREPGADDE